MHRLILAALLMAATGGASAQAVYRCVQKGKPVSYQTDPCPKAATISAIREFTPDHKPTPGELAQQRREVEREMAARNQAARSSGTHTVVTTTTTVRGESCSEAKAARDAWERRIGLKRTVDGLRYWQDRVYRACR